MTNNIRVHTLKIMTIIAAILGCLLRSYLYASAIDRKGLLISGHWATLGLIGLTVLFLAGLVLLARNPEEELDYWDCFTPSIWRCCGSLMAATAILLRTLWSNTSLTAYVDKITVLFGVAAAIGLLIASFAFLSGSKPSFLCHSAVSIYFALQMVAHYRQWSADPQLMDYFYYVAAFICLMLSAYFLTQFHVNPFSHRALWISAMAAVYFCVVAIPESGDTTFLLLCAIWAFTCLPQMEVKHRRQRPAMEFDEEF